MLVNDCTNFIQSLLYPGACLLCGSPIAGETGFCDDCRCELPYNRSCCPSCALPMRDSGGLPCGRCSRHPPPFSRSQVPLLYQPPLNRLIGDFKFRRKLHLAVPLSRLLLDHLPGGQPLPDAILPVPLHPRRLRERGFNQALELARILAGELGLALDWRSCRRVRATPPQSGLDRQMRRRNLRAAFQADATVSGRYIAILDDVITTGATVTAVSLALLQAGAARVDVWALARTPQP